MTTALLLLALSTQPQAPSGSIAGIVIDAHTGRPLANALVRAAPHMGRGLIKSTVSDEEGRFAFADLPQGAYVLSAQRPGYLPTNLGQRRQDGPGTPIELAEGETRDKIAIPMSRGGVIVGRVVDDYGDPVTGVRVHVVPHAGFRPGARTDDRGLYRIYGLTPGDYVVQAQVTFMAHVGSFAKAGPVSTFFPSTTDMRAAQRVKVRGGEETSGVNITLVTARLADITGRAVNSRGGPMPGATVNLVQHLGRTSSSMANSTVKPDGTFQIRAVPPGEYGVEINYPPHVGPGEVQEKARARVQVDGETIDDLLLVGERGATVRGRVVTDTGEPLPIKHTQLAVMMQRAPDEVIWSGDMPAVLEDFSFELKNLFGRHRLDVSMNAPSGQWAVKSVRWRDQEIGHRFIEYGGGQVFDDVEVVMSNDWATLSGYVRDQRNDPVVDMPLVLFPTDAALWIPFSRYLRTMRTAPGGRYGLSTLFGGEYYVAMAPHLVVEGDWQTPEFLRSLIDVATRITIADGEEQVLELRVRREIQE